MNVPNNLLYVNVRSNTSTQQLNTNTEALMMAELINWEKIAVFDVISIVYE